MGKLFQGLIQAKAHNRRDRGEIVDGKKNIPWLVSIHKIEQHRLPRLGEMGRRGRDLKAALPPKIFAFRQHLEIAGSDNAHHNVGTARFEGFRAAFKFECQVFHNNSRVELPITKPARRLIAPVRPTDKIVNTSCSKPVPGYVTLLNTNIFRALDSSAITKVFHHLAVALESNRREARDSPDSLLPLFRTSTEEQIRDAFLRD